MRLLETENFKLMIGMIFVLCIIAVQSDSIHASVKPITCDTNFGEKSFTIQESTVAFHNEESSGRSISSIIGVQTRKSHKGFNKTTYINGNKHLIHISNVEKFNSNNDFMAVTSPKGHKMTYPINCNFLD